MKRRVKLYSVDKTAYPDTFVMAEIVDNVADKIDDIMQIIVAQKEY